MTTTDQHWLVRAAIAQGVRPDPGNTEPRNSDAPVVDANDPEAGPWLAALMRGCCQTVAQTGEGSRNDTLYKQAFRIGTFVSGGYLDEGDARLQLMEAAGEAGLSTSEAGRTIRQGFDGAQECPATLQLDSREAYSLEAPVMGPESATDASGATSGGATPETSLELPTIPEEFWEGREVHAHIRQAAHSRNRSSDVALHSTLARLAALAPHNILVDTGVGGFRTSLNYFCVIAGPSGAGKTSGSKIAQGLRPVPFNMDPDSFRDAAPIGSGEGLAEAYMGTVDQTTSSVNASGKAVEKTEKVRQQVRHNALFVADEGKSIMKQLERSGTIIGPTIRTAWSGDVLGQTNGTSERTRYVINYSMGMIIGFQPGESIEPLLADAEGGTPQRFVYVSAIDSSIPDEPVEWPGPLPEHFGVFNPPDGAVVDFPDSVNAEIRATDLARSRGEVQYDIFDSQSPLMRIKIAVLLGMLDGRLYVNEDDWKFAAMLLGASRKVLDALLDYSRGRKSRERDQKNRDYVERETQKAVAINAVPRAVERVAQKLAKYVTDSGDLTHGAAKRKLTSKDRAFYDASVEYGSSQGWFKTSEHGLAT